MFKVRCASGATDMAPYDGLNLQFLGESRNPVMRGTAFCLTTPGGGDNRPVTLVPAKPVTETCSREGDDDMSIEIEGKGYVEGEDGRLYRVRKLTPRECMRLMGYEDAEIDRLESATTTMKNGNVKRAFSDSAIYRFAGNSVVVPCFAQILGAIARDMECPRTAHRSIEDW